MNINVLHICSNLGIGGTQKALQIIVRNLNDSKFTPHVCGFENGGKRGDILRRNGYSVFVPEDKNKLKTYICDHNIDLVHLHGFDKWNAAKDIISVTNESGIRGVIKTDNFGWADRKQIQKNIDKYHFISNFCYHRYNKLNNTSMEKFDVVPYPLDDSDFIKDSTSGGKIVDHDGPLIGKIGRPSPSKWGDLLIPAFSKALSKIKSLKLLLVGAPPKIKEQIKDFGVENRVIYRKQLPPDDVTKFYENIDILTHTSAIGESFGYVIAESLAAGTPVIVNSTPMQDNAQIELVDNSVNGFVANSSSTFSRAIVKLLSNPQLLETFSKNGVRKMREEYHISNIIGKIEKDYIDIYNNNAVDCSEHNSDYGYNSQLNDHISGCDPKYTVEKQLWHLISWVPLSRKQLIYRLTSKFVRNFP